MEKLKEAGLGRVGVFLLPLIIFACGHYSLGRTGVLLALLLGAILAAMYQWRRDLNANILAHFLVDFIADVLPRLVH
jgi:membrane protease YdiL (CAAX protease family)